MFFLGLFVGFLAGGFLFSTFYYEVFLANTRPPFVRSIERFINKVLEKVHG